MDERLFSIAVEESKELGITQEEFIALVKEGCKLIFKDDIEKRIAIFGGDAYPLEDLRELLLVCVQASVLFKCSTCNQQPS